jgi:hypothetical protein
MPNAYYQVLGHVFTAVHACKESGELQAVLQKGGLPKSATGEGEQLAHRAEDLIRKKVDAVGEDRIREHSVHASASEVEMWMQTVAFRVKKAVEEESVVELVLAREIHAHEHAVTVVAQSLRMMSMLRCDDRVYDALGGARPTRQLLNQGQSLLKKLYKAAELRLEPDGDEAQLPVFDELETTERDMKAWLRQLDAASGAVAEKDLRLLGRLGWVPEGAGLPVGGTSYAVVLHERGQTEAPDPNNVYDCTGWSIGRQGRNRENLGKGWTASSPEG